MNQQELKINLASDIKMIRQLEPEIIPARLFYGTCLKLGFIGFLLVGTIITISLAFTAINHPFDPELAGSIMEEIQSAAFEGFFSALGAMLLLSQSLIFYIQFRFHLENKLKTGPLLAKKFRQIAYLFLGLFALSCAMFASYADSKAIILMIGFSFVGSLMLTYFLVSMELNRIGLSMVFSILNEFFTKGRQLELPPK